MSSDSKANKPKIPVAAKRFKIMKMVKKVDRLLNRGASLMDSINELGDNPKLRNYAGVGMKVARMGLGLEFIDPLSEEKWIWGKFRDTLDPYMLKMIRDFPCEIVDTGNKKIRFYNVLGHVLVVCDGDKNFRHNIDTDWSEIRSSFREAIWERTGKWCKMEISGNRNSGNHKLEFLPGDSTELLDSQLSQKISRRLRRFMVQGINRSVMLHGPPGTGKTSIINKVANDFGSRVLSIEVGELAGDSRSDVKAAIRLLKPDVLAINDFDRFAYAASFLTTLEELNNDIRLFLVSVNNCNYLPRAAIRPGRFDELIAVTHLDEEVANKLLNIDVPKEIFDDVKFWPPAFIDELGQRISVLGPECVLEEYKALKERVEYNVDPQGKK